MELTFNENETSGCPFLLDGAIETILKIIGRHDGRLRIGILCCVIERAVEGYDPEEVLDAICICVRDADAEDMT